MDFTGAALVGISHGTASPDGQVAVRGLIDAVEAAVGEGSPLAASPAMVRLGHVDVQQPDVAATLAALPPSLPAVVVPLLLSAGYHVHVDLRREIEAVADRRVRLAAALGPDDRLVGVLRRRLDEAGAAPDDLVVLAVAGSSDERAVDDCRDMGERLAAALGAPVTVGFLSAAEPRLADAIAAARLGGAGRRVIAASYLLAPGYFQDLAASAGADLVTDPLLTPNDTPSALVDIVLDRFAAAAAAASAASAASAAGA
ncbi:cobalamin biosynthesis protein CbiX [Agromyces badenianii]|uniref:Cobalamin biosynthesis protein CbiX n=1 Tax=Agromyces badenianii TaxID=2080742 RepID=A0A2S0WXA6_9MICO|nr:CbiX/SirB N-terminal domain-containing protein [Agromyces badenianii]AWB95979.1 cobalamin biosynthesis protein CbiX [Agromyces badenianii]